MKLTEQEKGRMIQAINLRLSTLNGLISVIEEGWRKADSNLDDLKQAKADREEFQRLKQRIERS